MLEISKTNTTLQSPTTTKPDQACTMTFRVKIQNRHLIGRSGSERVAVLNHEVCHKGIYTTVAIDFMMSPVFLFSNI